MMLSKVGAGFDGCSLTTSKTKTSARPRPVTMPLGYGMDDYGMRDGCPKLCISAERLAFREPGNVAFLQNGSRVAFPTMMHFCSTVRILCSRAWSFLLNGLHFVFLKALHFC